MARTFIPSAEGRDVIRLALCRKDCGCCEEGTGEPLGGAVQGARHPEAVSIHDTGGDAEGGCIGKIFRR